MPGPYLNQGVFRTTVSQVDTTPQEELGIWRFEAGKILRYVKANAAIPAGASVKADAPIVTAALMGNQVVGTTGVTDMLLGVMETTLPLGQYGWITCFGPATAMVVTNTIPAQGLAPGASSGVLGIAATCNYNAAAVAIQTGLSAGSAIFITVL